MESMINMKNNQKLCAICNKEIISLGFENRIIKNHQDKGNEFGLHDLDAEISIKEFSADPHLNCRINCARYYVAGLAPYWYTTRLFDLTTGNKTAYQAIEQLKKMNYSQLQSNGIYLFGSPGVGKTLLLTELCKNIATRAANPSSIFWANTSTILKTIRSSFGRKYEYGEDTVSEKIHNRLRARYLFLDDLGTESATEWAKEILYEAINYRLEEQLPLFISSNLSPQGLSERLNDRFASRVVEKCKPVAINGEDIRLKRIPLNSAIPEFSYQMANWELNTKII